MTKTVVEAGTKQRNPLAGAGQFVLDEQESTASSRILVVGDYGQLEPRLMAHFSQDPNMLAIYAPGGHGDIYRDMASRMFGVPFDEVTKDQRGMQKVNVLAMGYGAHAKKVGSILTVNGYPTTQDVGAAYVAEIVGMYGVFFEWREQVITRVKKTGYVETLGGRHRRLKAQFADRRNWKNIGYGERQAVNAIIQGSAGDIVRRVMIAASRLFPELALLIQVHDELVWEALRAAVTDELLARLQKCGEEGHGFKFRVPLSFEPHVGISWYEAKEGFALELPDGWAEEDESVEYEEE